MAEGMVGVVAGLAAVLWPAMTPRGLLYVIAGWAIATGTLKIETAITLRGEVENGWLLAGSGALSVLLGVVLAVLVGFNVQALAPFIGVFAIVVGLALFVFRTRVRQRHRQAQPSGTRTARSYSPLHPSQIEPKAPFRGNRLR